MNAKLDLFFPCNWQQLKQVAADLVRALPDSDRAQVEAGLDCFNLHYLGLQTENPIEQHQAVLLFDIVNRAALVAELALTCYKS